MPNAWYLLPPQASICSPAAAHAWWLIPPGMCLFIPPGYTA